MSDYNSDLPNSPADAHSRGVRLYDKNSPSLPSRNKGRLGMIFAESEGALITAVIVGIGGLVSALAAAAVLIFDKLHKNRQERDSTTIGQWEAVADRMQKQLDLQGVHIYEQGDAILQLHEEHSNCQIELAEVHGNLDRVCDCCERMALLLRELGKDPGNLPKRIERKPRPDKSALEFRMRSLQQRSQALNQQSSTIETPQKQNGNS
jgi:hypothetical protein